MIWNFYESFTFNCFRAVVLGYRLPGIKTLNLTREHVVGIYNGSTTWWNESSIQVMHKNLTNLKIYKAQC